MSIRSVRCGTGLYSDGGLVYVHMYVYIQREIILFKVYNISQTYLMFHFFQTQKCVSGVDLVALLSDQPSGISVSSES